MKNTLITVTMASLLVSGCASKNEVITDKQESKTIQIVSKSDIKQNDSIMESALHDAVRSRDLDMVQLLVSQKVELNSQNKDGYTPLHIAVRLKEYEITKFLIENGALVNTIDNYNDTPLLDSTRDNYSEISKLLICNDAKRDVIDEHDMTPLHNSSKNKNIEISNMLLANNLDQYCKTDEEVIEEDVVEEQIAEVEEEQVIEIEEENTVEEPETIETNEVVFKGLYDELMEEFKNDFDVWDAELTQDDLLFRFNNPLALFETGKSDLKTGFTDILSDFFPRYLKVLEQHKDKIKEIRVEGHTSSEYRGVTSASEKYNLNKVLSDKRAKKVRNYVVEEASKTNKMDNEWTENTFKGYGMSSDDLILNEDGTENIIASRRVDFKIIQIEQ
ncbi:ankyrin repeat domain-containing protein [Arcobacteraceae bacterium]|nr:ankyrin repeat domain-containing protein [Arcobacteraceae bacterium]